MNTTNNLTRDCNPLGLYSTAQPPVPPPVLWVALVYYYCVTVFGTLGNASVLWCVATCSRARRPIKVLLFGVFLPVLVICLVPMPMLTELFAALLTCDEDRTSKRVIGISMGVIYTLQQIEQIAIAAIAVVRAVAVWAPHRPQLGIRGAVMLLVATCIYAILVGVLLVILTKMKLTNDPQTFTYITIFSFVNQTLPALITAAAYIFMITVIQRNRRREVGSGQRARVATAMDQATRAMLAVFISNLVFGVTHSVFHLMGRQSHYASVVVHIIFYTHYIVDPFVYMWLNNGYRQKILSSIRKVTQTLSSLCKTQPAVQTGSTASCDHHNQENSSPHTQDDSNL